MVMRTSSLYSSPAMASSSLVMLPTEPSLPEGEIVEEQAGSEGNRQLSTRPPITPIPSFTGRNDTSTPYIRGSPMARTSSQRRISLELSGSNLVLQASPRGTRTPQPLDEYRFPSASTPTRQVPATRRQSSRSSQATNTGSSNTLSSTNYSTTNVTSITATSSRDYFSSDVGSSECLEVPFPSSASLQNVNSSLDSPSVRRAARHVSLSGVAATSVPASSSVESLKLGSVPASAGVTGPVPIPPRPAHYHMRYNSEMNSNRNQVIPSSRSDVSMDQKTRLRFESENGSLYTNTLGSLANDEGSTVSGAMRMARELSQSAAAPSKHKLVVVEEGKPNVTFQMGNCIGRGQFGSVYRALNLNTGQMVAVKRIKLEGLAEDEVTQLMGEVDLLKSLTHPSVVKYEGLVRGPDVVSIILEFVENGSLSHTLKAFGNFPEKLVASYVVKILEGLNYLHEMKVVHCDLKAANILTTKNGNVKLSDFGVSLNLKAVKNIKNDAVGTPNWMAPEVIELKGVSTAADIWSLGCTIIELLTGKPPYGDMLAMSALWRIVEDDCPPFPDKISPQLRDFLTLCFQKDPSKRPSAEKLFEHEWLRKTLTGYKELRLQDSVPFLRRISADARRMDARSLHKAIRERGVEEEDGLSHMERSTSSPPSSLSNRPHLVSMRAASAPDSWSMQPMPMEESALSLSSEQTSPMTPLAIPLACSPPAMSLVDLSMRRSSDPNAVFDVSSPDSKDQREAAVNVIASSPSNPSFLDLSSGDGCSLEENAGRMHAFVKITFSKAVLCKVCRDPVKKHAVLCEECGLICHASCTRKSMLPCDLRTQLLMYASQAFPSRGSMDIARATSPGLMRGNGAVSPALSSEQETPPLSPRLFKFSFARNKRNSNAGQTTAAAAQATHNNLAVDHLQLPPTPTSSAPTSSIEPKTPTAASPPSELGSPGRRRRISLLPYLSRPRSSSPAPLSAAALSLSRSTSSPRIEQGRSRRDDSLGYGSSISSAASSGLCDLSMSKTDSSISNNANLDEITPTPVFKKNNVHRHSIAAASTPQLASVTDKKQHDAVEKAKRRQSATPQRVTARVSEVTFASDSQNTESRARQSTLSPPMLSPGKRHRRISTTKQDCVVM